MNNTPQTSNHTLDNEIDKAFAILTGETGEYAKLYPGYDKAKQSLHQLILKERIDTVNSLFKGWVDLETDEHWKYMTIKHRDQILSELESNL